MSKIEVFTAEQTRRLTGLSARQLSYWDSTDFFSPEVVDDARGRAFSRVYSFRDVVGLRVIGLLRNKYKVPLQELRRVGDWLRLHHRTPWSSLRLAMAGRRIVFSDPNDGVFRDARTGEQAEIDVALEPIARATRAEADRLRDREPDQVGRIVRNRNVVHNAWVVAGTRIPIRAIRRMHEAGMAVEGIIEEYPRLTRDDVLAAIRFVEPRQRAA